MKKKVSTLAMKPPKGEDLKSCSVLPQQEFAVVTSLHSARVKKDRMILINQLRKSGVFG